MNFNRGYDEVMIVNPYDPLSGNQQIKLMRFHQTPQWGYYAEPPEIGYYAQPAGYAYYAEPQEYGYYAEPPEIAYYGEPPEVAYYGEPQEFADYGEGYGYYAEPPEYGYCGEQPEIGEYEPPVGYYAEEQPVGGYAQAPEMVGYRDYEPLSEANPEGVGDYGQPDYSGYVRETATPAYNPGCPMPTNVAGLEEAEPYAEAEPFAGYQRPATVNPSCGQFTPQPGITEQVPEAFKPLW